MIDRFLNTEQRIAELKTVDRACGIRARVYNSANITLTTGVALALTFNSERYDTDAFHSTSVNTSRLTIPYDGYYRVTGNVLIDANATGSRQLRLLVNNTTLIALVSQATASGAAIMQITSDYAFVTGDYVELIAFQNSGGNLNVSTAANYSPEFWIDKLID